MYLHLIKDTVPVQRLYLGAVCVYFKAEPKSINFKELFS